MRGGVNRERVGGDKSASLYCHRVDGDGSYHVLGFFFLCLNKLKIAKSEACAMLLCVAVESKVVNVRKKTTVQKSTNTAQRHLT